MSEIPLELTEEILLRVPAEPLFRFRSVCKEWLRIIDDKTFIKLHQTGGDRLLMRTISGRFYSLPLSSLECSHNNHTVVLENMTFFNHLSVPKEQPLSFGSANGLILINNREDKDKLELSNPLTRELFVLPRHDHLMFPEHKYRYLSSGIGFDSTTDDFKVVRILEYDDFTNQTLIYSLNLNSWKRSTDFPFLLEPDFCSGSFNGLFINGALHWLCHYRPWSLRACIIVFDLSTEKYRVWQIPRFLSVEASTLDLLDGNLCLRNRSAIWMMKDYGQNVWTEFVHVPNIYNISRPLAYIKSKGQVLFKHGAGKFLLVDVEKKCARKFSILEKGFWSIHSHVLPSSLYRLNQSGGLNKSMAFCRTLRKRKRTANNRLKVELKVSDVQ